MEELLQRNETETVQLGPGSFAMPGAMKAWRAAYGAGAGEEETPLPAVPPDRRVCKNPDCDDPIGRLLEQSRPGEKKAEVTDAERNAWRKREIEIRVPKAHRAYAKIVIQEREGKNGQTEYAGHMDTGLHGGGGLCEGPGRSGIRWWRTEQNAIVATADRMIGHWRSMLQCHGGRGSYTAKRIRQIECLIKILSDWRAEQALSVAVPAPAARRVRAASAPASSSDALIPAGHPDALTAKEKRELASLERVIERGVATFRQVGGALAEIRDQALYRETHGTFQAYCTERWGFERNRGYQLITGAQVVDRVMSTIGDKLPPPANEAQARELAKVEEDQQGAVWKEIIKKAGKEGKPVTASMVAEFVHEWVTPADELREEREREREEEREKGRRGERESPAADVDENGDGGRSQVLTLPAEVLADFKENLQQLKVWVLELAKQCATPADIQCLSRLLSDLSLQVSFRR
jgi:hypothetical protein